MNQKDVLYSQFDNFSSVFISKYFPKVLQEHEEVIKDIKEKVSDYYRPTLIYLINEKRIEGNLVGDSAESRYDYFNNLLCKQGIILEEVENRFPELNHRVVLCIQKYLDLLDYVKSKFIKDFSELLGQGYINSKHSSPKMEDIRFKVTGDIHNGNGVCVVSYQGQKVVLKKKSSKPNHFLKTLDERISTYLEKEVHFIPEFMDREEYFWEKFIFSNPLNSETEAEEFYRRVGYLLAYAYILNISDLHFENLISGSIIPTLIDVETIFSISPYETIADNKATLKIIDRSKDSVLSTGLLPIAEADKIFGGDTSGVLGGTFIGEAKIVINNNRDDIRIEKKKYQVNNQDHLPYILDDTGEKSYLNAADYIEFIKSGFKELANFFIKDKVYLESLYRGCSDIQTRILFRNTRDYSLVRQLLISPVYSNQERILFDKMANRLSEYNNNSLIESERKQLLKMDIPYFYMNTTSLEIMDGDSVIWKLPDSALDEAIKKLRNLDEKTIEEQIALIEFSIKTPQALYSTELQEEYKKYQITSNNLNTVTEGLKTLVDIVLNDEIYSMEDDSVNWLTLKVTDYDAFELVPMDNSVYEGLAGVAIALSEAYNLVDSAQQEKIYTCLKRIFCTLVKSKDKVSSNSFYLGKLGLCSAIYRISSITGEEIPDDISILQNEYFLDFNNFQADFLSSFPSEIVALRNRNDVIKNLSQSLDKLRELAIHSEDFISWDNLESNNVSLAHGNLGNEVALLLLAGRLKDNQALELFKKAKNFDSRQKLNKGWIDKRNSGTSANWCHGSTGVLVARLAQLQVDDKYKILSNSERKELERDVEHAVEQIIEIGFDMTNFSLCHGISGNLLALSYYMNCLEGEKATKLKAIVDREYKKLHLFGLDKGWMCSFNTKYNVYGLMTGISGIIFSTAKYLKRDNSLDILIPKF